MAATISRAESAREARVATEPEAIQAPSFRAVRTRAVATDRRVTLRVRAVVSAIGRPPN